MINISGNSLNNWKASGVVDDENFITINSCGYQKFISRNLKIAREDGRTDFQIIYIIKGKGYYKLGNEIKEICEGNAIIYTPHIPQFYNYRFIDSTELYWVHFTGHSANEYLASLNLLDKQYYYIGSSSECIELFKKIIYELQMKRPRFENYAAIHFMEILSNISRKLTDFNTGNDTVLDEDIKNTIGHMYLKYNQNCSVGEYARICNLSLFRFIHKFKAKTGLTPVEYITKIRINEAKDLLSYSSLSISEVSSIVGYENQLYFSRVFKKIIGVPPSQYKNHTL